MVISPAGKKQGRVASLDQRLRPAGGTGESQVPQTDCSQEYKAKNQKESLTSSPQLLHQLPGWWNNTENGLQSDKVHLFSLNITFSQRQNRRHSEPLLTKLSKCEVTSFIFLFLTLLKSYLKSPINIFVTFSSLPQVLSTLGTHLSAN